MYGIKIGSADSGAVFSHELAHAFGLQDRYRDGPNGFSIPDDGYRGNLMGDLSPRLNYSQIGIVRSNTFGGWKPALRAIERK